MPLAEHTETVVQCTVTCLGRLRFSIELDQTLESKAPDHPGSARWQPSASYLSEPRAGLVLGFAAVSKAAVAVLAEVLDGVGG